jgi:small subunit ribosomal protein S13
MKEIVRLCNTDLDGKKSVIYALAEIRGVGFTLAKAVVSAAKIDPKRKLGELSDEEIEELEKIIRNPVKYGIPSYLLNRRKDYATGKDLHLVAEEVEISRKFDVQRLMRIKSWRGVRHAAGLPVRGRRLRGTFRRGKKLVLPKREKKKGRKG